ncbi:MAG: hypothetical protein HN390_01505 [Anaerolineae bacterium]|jgi:hypothetical protein|nr:hypothetical protein [Anaerolineae bacterium]
MKKSSGRLIFLVLMMFFLAGCELDNPRADADAYKTRMEADQAALDAKLTRSIRQADANWVDIKRDEKAAYWASIEAVAQIGGQIVTGFVYFGLIGVALSLAWSLSYGTVETAKAYATAAWIRARIMPLDANGMRPQFLLDDVTKIPADSFLGRIGLQHVRETKYYLNDTLTGESGMIDVTKPASDKKMEVYRQALIHNLTLDAQKKTAVFSKTGEVAEAMGQSDIGIPDAGRVLLDAEVQG